MIDAWRADRMALADLEWQSRTRKFAYREKRTSANGSSAADPRTLRSRLRTVAVTSQV